MIQILSVNGPFGAQDTKTGYDNTIISYLNLLFGASVGKDKINILLILSYCFFVILILSFWWVNNLIAQTYHTRFFFFSETFFDSHPTHSNNYIPKSWFGSFLLLILACLYPFIRFFLFNFFFRFSPIDFQFQPCFLFHFLVSIQFNRFSILQASYFFMLCVSILFLFQSNFYLLLLNLLCS